MKLNHLLIMFNLLVFLSVSTCYSQDFKRYGFDVNLPCTLEKDKEIDSNEARSIGYGRVNLLVTFSCLTSTGERGMATLYRVTYISHDVKVDMDIRTYAQDVCKRKESQGMKTKVISYKGRPACLSLDQAYIRNKIFDSGMIDFASGKTSYTLQVLTSDSPLEDRLNIIKRRFYLK